MERALGKKPGGPDFIPISASFKPGDLRQASYAPGLGLLQNKGVVSHELSEPWFSHLRIGDDNKSHFIKSKNRYHQLYDAPLFHVHSEKTT